ncbi:MAG TPA: hypothetical protein VIS05_02080 [Ilumatobacter sp.]
MRYSVSIVAEGDREIRLDEVVELADAVATLQGIASGAGSLSYGAQIVVEAEHPDLAVDAAIPLFLDAARRAGLPEWPVTRAETIGEIDELEALDP